MIPSSISMRFLPRDAVGGPISNRSPAYPEYAKQKWNVLICVSIQRNPHVFASVPVLEWNAVIYQQLIIVEFYLYPTVGTVLIHSVKPELTE